MKFNEIIAKCGNRFEYYAQCINCNESISETKKITNMWMKSHTCPKITDN